MKDNLFAQPRRLVFKYWDKVFHALKYIEIIVRVAEEQFKIIKCFATYFYLSKELSEKRILSCLVI